MSSVGQDLTNLFSLRKDFTIIALTGQHGSRYQDIGEQLSKGFSEKEYEDPDSFDLRLNSYKKYKIIYRFAQENFTKYTLIPYRDVITLCLLKFKYEELYKFIETLDFSDSFTRFKFNGNSTCDQEITQLSSLESSFKKYQQIFSELNSPEGIKLEYSARFCSFFLSSDFRDFSIKLHKAFQAASSVKQYLIIELLTNNIRKSGNPFNPEIDKDPGKVFSIVEILNDIIKAVKNVSRDNKNPTKIVIDSLRVPLEIMFFKQRYSAFYLIAVNREDRLREAVLSLHYKQEYNEIKVLFNEEYNGGNRKEYFKKNIRECIEKADIHITHRSPSDTTKLNHNRKDTTSPYYSWRMQLLKYVSLIEHPGLVTPSPEERSMQLAYAAKCNSGCISRQVGASITDENYSIKAIGWNNTPSGQTPCLIRNAETLLNATAEEIDREIKKEKALDRIAERELELQDRPNPELIAFTPYERTNEDFKKALNDNFKNQVETNRALLKGRNVCFCFKTQQNSISEGKNQVHTRSLHAEESAFLQITKYGGVGIRGGKLFTTASPCELCAKKAYQLGITVIYYLDPYPGISQKQILSTGSKKPEVRLFNGAIGSAYHWLYEPLMPYKDEMSLLLGQNIQDLASIQKEKISSLEKEIELLKSENTQLKNKQT
jgi:deoxycytidylate deaminase